LRRGCGDQAEQPTRRDWPESTRARFSRPGSLWLSPVGWWLSVVVCAEAVIALSIVLPMVFRYDLGDGCRFIRALAGALLVPVVLHATWSLGRQHRNERAKATEAAQLMETVLINCRELLGYEPSELLGQHWSVVAAFDALRLSGRPGGTPMNRMLPGRAKPPLATGTAPQFRSKYASEGAGTEPGESGVRGKQPSLGPPNSRGPCR
jgi:hypothetical protein